MSRPPSAPRRAHQALVALAVAAGLAAPDVALAFTEDQDGVFGTVTADVRLDSGLGWGSAFRAQVGGWWGAYDAGHALGRHWGLGVELGGTVPWFPAQLEPALTPPPQRLGAHVLVRRAIDIVVLGIRLDAGLGASVDDLLVADRAAAWGPSAHLGAGLMWRPSGYAAIGLRAEARGGWTEAGGAWGAGAVQVVFEWLTVRARPDAPDTPAPAPGSATE